METDVSVDVLYTDEHNSAWQDVNLGGFAVGVNIGGWIEPGIGSYGNTQTVRVIRAKAGLPVLYKTDFFYYQNCYSNTVTYDLFITVEQM